VPVEALSEQTEFSVGTGRIATQAMLACLSGEPQASQSGADSQPDTLPDEFAMLFAAAILAARRVVHLDLDKPNMAKGFFVDCAVEDAAFVMERIDARWPVIINSYSAQDL